jgi:hypothetical protein
VWSAQQVIELIHAGLARHEAALADEQAVRGLDALDEVQLHPLIADALTRGGLGVLREQPYPAQWRRRRPRRRPLPTQSERQRCDLVLTPAPGQHLRDTLADERARQLDLAQRRHTLFEQLPNGEPAAADAPTPGAIDAGEAYWLEVKTLGQFTYIAGVPQANPAYASTLVRGLAEDLAKLNADQGVRRGGVLLVWFVADQAVADHDSALLLHRLLDRGAELRAPVRSTLPIVDRIGNRACVLLLIEAVCRPGGEGPGPGAGPAGRDEHAPDA